ncbi:MAG: GAF domain-containing protein [Candidatus Eiseniibacteriota bacterium]|jgi:signal transduction histidine kinase
MSQAGRDSIEPYAADGAAGPGDPVAGEPSTDTARSDAAAAGADAAEPDRITVLRNELREYALLLKITGFLHRTLDIDEIIRVVLTAVTAGSALGFNRAVLLRSRLRRDELVGWSAVGPLSGEEASSIWAQLEADPRLDHSGPLERFEHMVHIATAARPRTGEFERRVEALCFPLAAGASFVADAALERAAMRADRHGGAARVPRQLEELLGTTALVAVPLCGRDRVVGVVVADNRFSGNPIRDEDVDLLTSLGRHAGVAMERALEHARVSQRLAERGRLHEITKGILSTTELDRELELIAETSAQLIGADWSTVWLCRETSPTVKVVARHGEAATHLEGRRLEAIGRIAQRAIQLAAPVTASAPSGGGEGTEGTVLCVPLTTQEQVVGAIAVGALGGRLEGPEGFDLDDQEILTLLADQAAIAIQNARLFRRIRRTEQRLREAETIRARLETLAALGEMSAKVSHEIRTPLASIGGFARLLVPHFAEGTGERRAAEVIVDETRRLERILNSQLDCLAMSRPKLGLCDLNGIVREVLELMYENAGQHRVRILQKLGDRLPRLLLDADHMKQVVLNLVQNGIDSLPDGGRLRIQTQAMSTHVTLEVATDGEPIPGAMLDRLFVPFASSKQGGTGLGLAVAHQIVREHGGQIRARSGGEWGAIFTVILPLRGHRDRRQVADRRHRMVDRRGVLDPPAAPDGAQREPIDGARRVPPAADPTPQRRRERGAGAEGREDSVG